MNTISNPILKLQDLTVTYGRKNRKTFAVQGISLSLNKGETIGIVGESGCGKTTVAMAMMGLLDSRTKVTGALEIDGKSYDFEQMNYKTWRGIRGNKIAMVFQDSLTALNPLKRVGDQIAESIFVKDKSKKKIAKKRALELLRLVEIPDPEKRYSQYPHECSGGMRQRVMIAMALANQPEILICDEPTTALDVTVQAQVLDLIKKLQSEFGMAVIFVTHDLGVVNAITDRVEVMYASKIIESGITSNIMQFPRHPYTQALLMAMPDIEAPKGEVHAIPGIPPTLNKLFDFCPFGSRCGFHIDECDTKMPELLKMEDVGQSQCACIQPLQHEALDA